MAVEKTKKREAAPEQDIAIEDPVNNGDRPIDELVQESEDAIEILEPKIDAKRWLIGKPPERGGKDTQYSVYIQQPLGFMARNRLYALIGRTMATAIKTTGGTVGGMDDIFGSGSGGTLIERGRRLSQQDFADASSFFTLALELVSYAPDFLSE